MTTSRRQRQPKPSAAPAPCLAPVLRRRMAIAATALAVLGLAGPCPADDTLQVVVLAGQSNMDGNVPASQIPQPFRQPPPNVTLLNSGKEELIGGGMTFGPEVGFAAAVAAARPNRKFLMVKHAKGGTSMAGWSPNWDKAALTSKYDLNAGPLYRTLKDQLATAIKDKPARVTAVLWMQGESDTRYPHLGPKYFENLSNLIAAFRKDLKSPALPFFFGRVNMPADVLEPDKMTVRFPFIPQVRAGQERASREIPGAVLIETDDLGKQADRIHYDAAGQIELGRRFAEAWLKAVPE